MARVRREVDPRKEKLQTEDPVRAELWTLGRRANERLRKLERSGNYDKSYAYDAALKYFKDKGRNRFLYSGKKLTNEEVSRELSQIQKFLGYKTSTASGIKKFNKAKETRFKNMMKQKGIEMSDVEYASIMDILSDSKMIEKMNSYMTSDKLLTRITMGITNPEIDEKTKMPKDYKSAFESIEIENNKLVAKTKEQADYINDLLGITLIEYNVGPTITEEENDDMQPMMGR